MLRTIFAWKSVSGRCAIVARVVVACALSAAVACKVETPLTPAPNVPSSPASAPDGTTLKVGAPTLVSPINSDIINTQQVTLTISGAPGLFTNQAFNYDFELQTDAGAVVAQATVNGTTFTVPATLTINSAYRWRSRATLNGAVGPWSGLGRFQTPRLSIPTAASSDSVWKTWFFAIIDLRGVGPIASAQALTALIPDFNVAGVLLETNSAGQPRGRIYLPTGNPNNKFGRSVDIGSFGGPWQWLPRGGTTCEGGSCIQ